MQKVLRKYEHSITFIMAKAFFSRNLRKCENSQRGLDIRIKGERTEDVDDRDGRLVVLVVDDDEVLVEYLLLVLLSVNPLSDAVEDNNSWFFLRSLSAILCAKLKKQIHKLKRNVFFSPQ